MRNDAEIASKARVARFCASIRAEIAGRRDQGMARAMWTVAGLLGLPERRVRAAYYGEVRRVDAPELAQLQGRLRVALIERERRLDSEIIALRQAISALDGGPGGITGQAVDGVDRTIAGASPARARPMVGGRG